MIEFDAMEEPPSVLDVEVFDFDGPFDQGVSLGHAEINFLKLTADELADLCVPLVGHHAQASQSKLQLRIFLENKNGVETMKDYLSKVEKEVGKKVNTLIYCREVSLNGQSLQFDVVARKILMSDPLFYVLTVEHSVATKELRFPETVWFAP